jgi:hypothetical protein
MEEVRRRWGEGRESIILFEDSLASPFRVSERVI